MLTLCARVQPVHIVTVLHVQSFPGKTPEESAAQLKWEQHFSDQQKEQASKPDKSAEAAAYAPPAVPSPHP